MNKFKVLKSRRRTSVPRAAIRKAVAEVFPEGLIEMVAAKLKKTANNHRNAI